jgi:hypothetical protein
MTSPAPLNETYAAVSLAAVTPADSGSLTNPSRAIYVGTGGDMAVVMLDGSTGTFKNVSSGTLLPISVTQVKLTGTTAANILALL